MKSIPTIVWGLFLAWSLGLSVSAQSDIIKSEKEHQLITDKYKGCENVKDITETMCKVIVDCGGTLKINDKWESSYMYNKDKASEFQKCIVDGILSGKHNTSKILDNK